MPGLKVGGVWRQKARPGLLHRTLILRGSRRAGSGSDHPRGRRERRRRVRAISSTTATHTPHSGHRPA